MDLLLGVEVADRERQWLNHYLFSIHELQWRFPGMLGLCLDTGGADNT